MKLKDRRTLTANKTLLRLAGTAAVALLSLVLSGSLIGQASVTEGVPSATQLVQSQQVRRADLVELHGKADRWHRGPELTAEESESEPDAPNPFLIDAFATVTKPSGQVIRVPLAFAGNGRKRSEGDVWRLLLSPDELGDWSYEIESSNDLLDGQAGAFEVVQGAAVRSVFIKFGRIEHRRGEPSFRHATGEVWTKTGSDDPENLLGLSSTARLKILENLAEFGINSVYVITHNVCGDHSDVWPWIGDPRDASGRCAVLDASIAERFDLARLRKWETFFDEANERGLAIHIVLEDEDNTWQGFDAGTSNSAVCRSLTLGRCLYYREMVARFGYLNGLLWNLGEEFDEAPSQATHGDTDDWSEFAAVFRELDGDRHPIGLHLLGDAAAKAVGCVIPPRGPAQAARGGFDFFSWQFLEGGSAFAAAVGLEALPKQIARQHELCDPDMVFTIDETPQIDASDRDGARSTFVWPALLAAAGVEIHYAPGPKPVDTAKELELVWRDTSRARSIVERAVLGLNRRGLRLTACNARAKDLPCLSIKQGKKQRWLLYRADCSDFGTFKPGGLDFEQTLRWFEPVQGATELSTVTVSTVNGKITFPPTPDTERGDCAVLVSPH